ncbi:hypothetical protein EMIT0180MI3_20741 [Priestia megaterium]
MNLELNVKRGTSDFLTHTLAHSQLKNRVNNYIERVHFK